MSQVAKLFMNGRSQAVRLPLSLRFEGDEVFIRRDSVTGDVILSQKPNDWRGFFAVLDAAPEAKDFILDRDANQAEDRDLF